MTQILNKSHKLIEAIKILEGNKSKICIILSRGKLIGTITDGDIRRHLIKKGSLDVKVFEVMNKNPICGNMESTSHELYESMKRYSLLTIPIIDESKKYIKSVTLADLPNIDLKTKNLQKNSIKSVVIMAGGEGKRLMPLTKYIPKPMVEIAGIPILERQIAAFVKLNIKNIYISVAYLSNKICDYFGNGKIFGANIFYIHETIKLGTAGRQSTSEAVSGARTRSPGR
jgi:CBS domain-containing protein